jgi:hypothetical protein
VSIWTSHLSSVASELSRARAGDLSLKSSASVRCCSSGRDLRTRPWSLPTSRRRERRLVPQRPHGGPFRRNGRLIAGEPPAVPGRLEGGSCASCDVLCKDSYPKFATRKLSSPLSYLGGGHRLSSGFVIIRYVTGSKTRYVAPYHIREYTPRLEHPRIGTKRPLEVDLAEQSACCVPSRIVAGANDPASNRNGRFAR